MNLHRFIIRLTSSSFILDLLKCKQGVTKKNSLNGLNLIYLYFRFVSSPEEVLEVIEEGKSNRHVAVTSKIPATFNTIMILSC